MPNQPTRISEAKARAARTAIQFVPAGVVVEIVDSTFWDMDDRQYAAILAGLTIVFSWVQTAIENKTGYALLRKFSRNDPALVSTPTTPLNDPTQNKLPEPVKNAQPGA